MLILNRHPIHNEGQAVQIGDDIRIYVLSVTKNGGVRIGIDAPKHVNILRDEAVNREPKSE